MKTSFTIFILLLFFLHPAASQSLQNVKIYVNPGHGGHDGDDRNVVIAPFLQGDPKGFWESNSNLDKGLRLRDLLQGSGASVIMSRVTNTSADDRNLTVIAEEANANGVDFMISIHSNAHNGSVNYPLMLFHGWDNNPLLPASMDLANLFWENLISNTAGHWTYTSRTVRGDKSFAPESWNGYGVLRPLTVPGLISEGAFHDYIPETYRLMNMDYKHLEAWHFYKSFLKYYANAADPKGKVAGHVRDVLTKVTAYGYALNSPDQQLPLNGAVVTLNPGGLKYTVDNMNNGFFLFDNLTPGQYTLTVENQGYYAQSVVDVPVIANTVTYKNVLLQQVRDKPLSVVSYSPKVDPSEVVNAGTSIDFVFNYEVDRPSFEAAFSIAPAVEGTFTYSDQDRQVSFRPNGPLGISTLYQVRIDKSAKHVGDLAMAEDFVFSFTTANRNKLTIVSHYPAQQQGGVYPNTLIRIYFDRAVMTDKLTSQINLADRTGKIITKTALESNTVFGEMGSVAFRAMNLTPGMEYTVTVDGALLDADNLPLGAPASFRFTVANAPEQTGTLLDDFETSRLVLSSSQCVNIDAAKTATGLYSTIKMLNKYSQRFLYNFTAPNAVMQIGYSAPFAVVRKNQSLGMYVWGDFSMAQLSVLVSNSGNVYELPLTDIDFGGWQFKSINLNSLPFEGDGLIEGLRLISDSNALSKSGFVLLDQMVSVEGTFTGVENPLLQPSGFIVVPNPVRNQFRIVTEMDGVSMVDFVITDLSGKLVMKRKGFAVSEPIDASGLKPGLYLVQLTHQQKVEVIKVQKL
ncbi:MAG: Ig-like domain-containing protein [Breznakibacter sp.]